MSPYNTLKSLAFLLLTVPVSLFAESPLLPELGDSSATAMSPEQEEQIGSEIVRRMRNAGYIIDDPLINKYIDRVGLTLAANSEAGQAFSFFVVDAPSINAFALPGGYIGIHSGLIIASQSESELASVMAHEIAHVTQHHLARRLEEANRTQLPITLALLAAILIGNGDPNITNAAIASATGGAQQMQLNFTRAHEHEADRIGMQLLADSNFDPRGMAGFFSRLQDEYRYHGEGVPEFLRTHPVTTNRLAEAESAASQYPATMHGDSDAYQVAKARLRIHHTKDLTRLKQRVLKGADSQSNQKQSSRYLLALIYDRQHQTPSAIKELRQLIAAEPNSIAYRETLAQILIKEGRYQEATSLLTESLKRFPENEILTLSLVKSLIALKHYSEARELLQNLLRANPSSSRGYFQLSELESKSEHQAASHIALAEYYKLKQEPHSALQQLKLAKKIKKLDFYHASRIEALNEELVQQIETQKSLSDRSAQLH